MTANNKKEYIAQLKSFFENLSEVSGQIASSIRGPGKKLQLEEDEIDIIENQALAISETFVLMKTKMLDMKLLKD